MIDNTDINTLIVDAIMINNENQAGFILKKLNEDVVVTDTMMEALCLYEKGEEVFIVLPKDIIEGEED